MDLSLNRSELTALLLESLVYGIFLVLFFILFCIAFFSRRKTIPRKRYILPIAGHLVIDFLRALEAFVPNNSRQTPDHFFKKLSDPYSVLNWALYAIQTMLGDSVLVWRCYVFFDRRWWTIVPGAILIAFDTAVLVVVSRYLTVSVGAAFIHLTRPWMRSWIASTTALQVLYSIAIVVQISRKFTGTTGAGSHAASVVKAVVESCAVYTLFTLALLIAFERASDADWVLIDVITSIVGISFCLIIIQLHLHFWSDEPTTVQITTWAVQTDISGRTHDNCGSSTVAASVPKAERGNGIGAQSPKKP